jgi:hypothetical protein
MSQFDPDREMTFSLCGRDGDRNGLAVGRRPVFLRFKPINLSVLGLQQSGVPCV